MAGVNAWFDKSLFLKRLDPATKRALTRFGSFVRVKQKSLIGKVTKKISEPGAPPNSHTGILRKMILYGYDEATRSVVVGPAAGRMRGLPATLEYGGRSKLGKAQAARPSARPALDAEKPKLADMLRGMFNKG